MRRSAVERVLSATADAAVDQLEDVRGTADEGVAGIDESGEPDERRGEGRLWGFLAV